MTECIVCKGLFEPTDIHEDICSPQCVEMYYLDLEIDHENAQSLSYEAIRRKEYQDAQSLWSVWRDYLMDDGVKNLAIAAADNVIDRLSGICSLCKKPFKANQVSVSFNDFTLGMPYEAHKKCLNNKELRQAFEKKVDQFYCGGGEEE